MKNKSMMAVVSQLVASGHQVEYYIRKDGGILIRRIDGEHFSGAHGNARARQLVGSQLSEAREKQLAYATATRKAQRKLPNISQTIEEEYKRVKKIWNKAFKAKGGKPSPAGYFGKGRIKYAQKMYGEEEALRRIREAERYATGTAYSKNVQHLAMFIQMASAQYQSQELEKVAEDLLANAYAIKEETIYPAYQELYKLNAGQDPKEIAKNLRKILRL